MNIPQIRRPHDSPACPCTGCEAFDRRLSTPTERCGCCGALPGELHVSVSDHEGVKRCANDPDQGTGAGAGAGAGAICDPPQSVADDDGWRPGGLRPLTDLVACEGCGTLILKGDDKPRHCPSCIDRARADLLGWQRSKGRMACCACGAFVHDPGPQYVGVMCVACAANGGRCPPPMGHLEINPYVGFHLPEELVEGVTDDALKLANAVSKAAELQLLEDWPGTDVR